jgi:hypothetical protein
MHPKWIKFLDQVNNNIALFEKDSCDTIYFRGHSNESYKLIPSLLRNKTETKTKYLEQVLFYDFVSMAGSKIKNEDSWEILFTMRHYGVPTRLLDWTTSFANAIYFAISDKKLVNPHIWMLDPYKLSEKNKGFQAGGLLNPSYDLDNDYVKMFINDDDSKIVKPKFPIPLYPARNNPRQFAQQGVFTIHGTKPNSLEELAPECLKKIDIPTDCLSDAQNFLKLAGINEYSIYPDFTGLSNHLKSLYKL